MRFTKMQGLGNDYIYVDCTKEAPAHKAELARRMADRHFGVGSDGLICVCPSDRADFRMEMFNADGSRGEMCGNGIRCLGKYVWDKGLTDKTELLIETPAGIRQVELLVEDGTAAAATVDMGAPAVEPRQTLEVLGRSYEVTPVSMGNPHVVWIGMGVSELDLGTIGPGFAGHPQFPHGVNAEFVEVRSPGRLLMRVWERGSGETLACGTGACAALAAAYVSGYCMREVTVTLPGGDLALRWSEATGHIYMTGPAVTVFEGEWPETKR